MEKFNRRTLMAAGTTLAAGGLFGSTSAAVDEHGDDEDEGEGEDSSTDFERPDGVAWSHDGPHDIDATVATDGRVYTVADGGVYALDTEDGSLLWETGDVGAARTLSVEGDTVYTAGDPVQAIDAETGEIRWESDASSQPIEPEAELASWFDTRDEEIAVGHGMVYTSEDDTVYAIDAENGSIAWKRDEIVVVTDDGEMVAEELRMGDVSEDAVYVFEESFGDGGMFAELEPATGETVQTVASDESVSHLVAGSGHVAVVPGYDSSHLYDMSTQEMVDGSGPSYAHSIVDDTYFASITAGFFRTYNLSADATHLWDSEQPWRHGPPVLADGTVIAPFGPQAGESEVEDEDGLMAFDRDSGEEAWEYTFDEPGWAWRDVRIETDEDTVYVSRDGELLALRSGVEDDRDDEDPSLELSVSAPDSIARGESASFDLMVWNHGDEAVEVTVALEVSAVSESTTVEIPPGDCYASYHSVWCGDLSVGDNEWTVTADGETESGTLTVTEE